MKTYFNTKTAKFAQQPTASKSAAKIEITAEAIEAGKSDAFTVCGSNIHGFHSVVNGVSFDVIDLSYLANPENKYKVFFPAYAYDAEAVCIN